jgi:hypothetical protein
MTRAFRDEGREASDEVSRATAQDFGKQPKSSRSTASMASKKIARSAREWLSLSYLQDHVPMGGDVLCLEP